MKSIIKFLFIVACMLTMTCCQKKPTSDHKARFLNVNLPGEPKTMDPRKGGDVYSSAMHFFLFEGLTRVSEKATDDLALAKQIDISKDNLTYTFHLRESVWSNGKPLTAHDIAYSWKKMLDPNFQAPNVNLLYPIAFAEEAKKGEVSLDKIGIKVVDDLTLEIKLHSPTPYFLNLISFCVFFPVNQEIDETNPKWADQVGEDFICNGPYKMVKWSSSNEIILEKNETYWDKENVKLQGIHISLVEDENTALEMFKNKELDILGSPYTNVTIDAAPFLKEQNLLKPFPVGKTLICCFNTEKGPFQNKHIRKAFSLAMDREAIIAAIGIEGEIPAVNFVPPVLKKGKNKAMIPVFSPEEAKKELALGLEETGLSLSDFSKMRMIYPIREAHHKLSQILQEQWRETLGVTIQLEATAHSVFLTKTNNSDFDICQYYWVAQYDDPMNILDRFKKRASPKNYPKWENEEYIKLLDASYFASKEEREDLLEKAEELILEEMPIAPISHGCSYTVAQPDVKGIFTSSIGSVHLHKIEFKNDEIAKK